MAVQPPGDPLSIGMMWASRVTSLALGFALPPTLGAWVDNRYGSRPAGVLVGTAIGMVVGFVQVLQLARSSARPPRR